MVEKAETIVIDPSRGIEKRYKVRRTGGVGTTLEITLPREAYEREARIRGLTPEEFMEVYHAVWCYDSFEGLYLRFEPMHKPTGLEDRDE